MLTSLLSFRCKLMSDLNIRDMTCPTSLELGDFKNGSNPEDSVDKVLVHTHTHTIC